jgi:hypothetical protein
MLQLLMRGGMMLLSPLCGSDSERRTLQLFADRIHLLPRFIYVAVELRRWFAKMPLSEAFSTMSGFIIAAFSSASIDSSNSF